MYHRGYLTCHVDLSPNVSGVSHAGCRDPLDLHHLGYIISFDFPVQDNKRALPI
jgi:hypothetical protein